MSKLPRISERSEQAGIVKLLRSLGAVVYVSGTTRRKGDHPGTCQTPGIPDLEAFLPKLHPMYVGGGPSRTLLKVEVKAVGGRPSPAQTKYRDLCIQTHAAHVVGGLDTVIAWLMTHGYLKSGQVPHLSRAMSTDRPGDMSMETHTPGPWRIVFYNDDSRDDIAGIATTTPGLMVVSLSYDALQVRRADARLIAAAPDLLAALRVAHDALKAHEDISGTWELYQQSPEMQTIKAALARVDRE